MVVIHGVKYACDRCIRGHRVSGCTHADEALTMVKPKGRPTTRCGHCREASRAKGRGDYSGGVSKRCTCSPTSNSSSMPAPPPPWLGAAVVAGPQPTPAGPRDKIPPLGERTPAEQAFVDQHDAFGKPHSPTGHSTSPPTRSRRQFASPPQPAMRPQLLTPSAELASDIETLVSSPLRQHTQQYYRIPPHAAMGHGPPPPQGAQAAQGHHQGHHAGAGATAEDADADDAASVPILPLNATAAHGYMLGAPALGGTLGSMGGGSLANNLAAPVYAPADANVDPYARYAPYDPLTPAPRPFQKPPGDYAAATALMGSLGQQPQPYALPVQVAAPAEPAEPQPKQEIDAKGAAIRADRAPSYASMASIPELSRLY